MTRGGCSLVLLSFYRARPSLLSAMIVMFVRSDSAIPLIDVFFD
jgi:hypothetical protein